MNGGFEWGVEYAPGGFIDPKPSETDARLVVRYHARNANSPSRLVRRTVSHSEWQVTE